MFGIKEFLQDIFFQTNQKNTGISEIIDMQKLSSRIPAPPKQNRRNQNLNDSLIVSSCFRKKYLHVAFLTGWVFYLNRVVLSI